MASVVPPDIPETLSVLQSVEDVGIVHRADVLAVGVVGVELSSPTNFVLVDQRIIRGILPQVSTLQRKKLKL